MGIVITVSAWNAPGYKVVSIRLDPDMAAQFEELGAALKINQTAMLAAAVEIWVERWLASGGSVETFKGTDSVEPALQDRWNRWIAVASRIEAERLSREYLRVDRVNVMIRLDAPVARFLGQLSDLLGERMQTSVLTALIETWTEAWNETGVEPTREWPPPAPAPRWWPRWSRWCDLAARRHRTQGKRKPVVARLSPEMATDFARLVAGAGMSRTAMMQALLAIAAEDWETVGIAPTLVWRRKKPPPDWWDAWITLMERARRIGAERRGDAD